MHILRPPALAKNARIGLVSPASPVKPERLHAGIACLQELGFDVITADHALSATGYLAGSDVDRATDLNTFFAREDIDAIFCIRGGYGTPRLLPHIDFDTIRANPKIFVGYSDITALQLAMLQKTGLVTFSGPMAGVEFGLGINPLTARHFWQTLAGSQWQSPMQAMQDKPYQILRHGEATGRLVGGCLALINSIVGTPYLPDFRDKILFLEDIGETPMRLDRYLSQLKNAGLLQSIRGVIAGQFLDISEEDAAEAPVSGILEYYFGDLGIPVIYDFDYGHGRLKYTMPFGVSAHLQTQPLRIALTEPAVSLPNSLT